MQSSITAYPKVVVVSPRGHLTVDTAEDFQMQLTAAIASHDHENVLVDMEQVESLDSAGLMVLVSALSLAQGTRKRLSVRAVPASVRMVLELTQLDQVLEILDEPLAIAA